MQAWIIDKAMRGEVVCNIGQIDPETKCELERMARRGQIQKWRGRWFPVPGADFGIGPLKTCYANLANAPD